MANESKFLKWQDQDSDGLIDVCDDIIEEDTNPIFMASLLA